MKARQIIGDGGFAPEDVVFVSAVFDSAWHQVESRFANGGEERDIARERLARIVVALATANRDHGGGELEALVLAAFNRL